MINNAMYQNEIRTAVKEDLEGLKRVLDSIDLFPSMMLEDMIANYFNDADCSDIWFTKIVQEVPVSLGYCAPEKLAEGTFNLYALGVKQDYQGKGVGTEMLKFVERMLKEKGVRILIVETSSEPGMALSRDFYQKNGYALEAVIRDFWGEGDDKVVYWKKLNAVSNT